MSAIYTVCAQLGGRFLKLEVAFLPCLGKSGGGSAKRRKWALTSYHSSWVKSFTSRLHDSKYFVS